MCPVRTARLTQEELAERAGLSARAITDLERGVRRFSYLDTVARLVDALGLGDSERAELRAAAQRVGIAAPWQDGSHRQELLRPQLSGDVVWQEGAPPAASVEDTSVTQSAPVPRGGFLGALATGPLVGRERELQFGTYDTARGPTRGLDSVGRADDAMPRRVFGTPYEGGSRRYTC